MTTSRTTPNLSLREYTNAIEHGWPEDDLGRAIIHDLPRRFHALTADEQRQVIDDAPPQTGTCWDALLAATAEHICELHGHPVQSWMDEPERFLNETWVLAWTPSIRSNALAFAPPAFVRHGAVPDPRELDERGGDKHAWVPEQGGACRATRRPVGMRVKPPWDGQAPQAWLRQSECESDHLRASARRYSLSE